MDQTQVINLKPPHPAIEALRMFLRNPSAIAGMVLFAIVLLVALLGPLVYHADPFEIVGAPFTPPGEEGLWLGTDYLGRDVLVGILYGGRATLAVGATAALLSVVIGVSIGAFASNQARTRARNCSRVSSGASRFIGLLPVQDWAACQWGGSKPRSRKRANHSRNMSSVSMQSRKPACRILTVLRSAGTGRVPSDPNRMSAYCHAAPTKASMSRGDRKP